MVYNSYLYDAVRNIRFIPLNHYSTGAERTCFHVDWSATWSCRHRHRDRQTHL